MQIPFKKLLTTFSSSFAAVAIVIAGFGVQSNAFAEMSASVAVSNMYLFRGLNLTTSGSPSVSGSLDYGHESGFYGSVWTSSEGPAGSYEVDLIAGFSNEVGDFSYDVSLASYEYPGATGSEDYGDVAELILGFGCGGMSLTLIDALHSATAGGDYHYINAGYEMGAYGVAFGTTVSDTVTEYSHLDLSFAATEELSFVLSTVVDDDDTMDTDPLLSLMWSKSFDL